MLCPGPTDCFWSPCRLECQLDWTAEQDRLPEVEFELSPGWVADRVLIRGLEDPLDWHVSALPSGSTTVQVAIPASARSRGEFSLVVSASHQRGGSGVRFHCRGFARSHASRRRGLVGRGPIPGRWFAPQKRAAWPGSIRIKFRACRPRVNRVSNLRESLAWRWTSLRPRVGSIASHRTRAGASVRIDATVDPANGRLTLEGTLSIVAGEDALEAIPIWIDGASVLPH